MFADRIEWPQNHVNVQKLPEVKPPKKQLIKKTKESK